MTSRRVRAFPRTKSKPQKRILLIPFLLTFCGYAMTFVPLLGFIGTIIALTGVLTLFLVGTVYADLWAAHRRTQQLIQERELRQGGISEEDIEAPEIEDPFEETYDSE
ncbi:hypothetical protein EU527_03455 [Candidatus Thorarchaeota archaeon]|nr:MAG: hypothetical protein EU527_03455 [Candidatus Thorarchaeota archaeon]